ncbi:hypothetical protein M3Y99_00147600 [Aphelenchoides fujianensis]|nr:hypothetical protein M3Y99_00147600 [Aphelenchoides fujianensis]
MFADFSEAAFCPFSLCNKTDLDEAMKAACTAPHEERFPDEVPAGFFEGRLNEIVADYSAWGEWLFAAKKLRVGTYADDAGVRLYFRNHSETVRFDVPGWVGGFDAVESKTESSLLFHGVLLPEDEREAARAGVLTLEKAAIYRTSFGALQNGVFSLETPFLADPEFSLLDPKFLRDGSGRFFFTRLNTQTGESSVWLRDGNKEVLVQERAKQMDTMRLNGVDYVVFVASDEESGEFQFFLATFGRKESFPFQKSSPLESIRVAMYVRDTSNLYTRPEQQRDIDEMTISNDGTAFLIVVVTENEEYYDLLRANINNESSAVVEKLTPGVSSVRWPAFLGNDGDSDFVVVSNIANYSHCFDDPDQDDCRQRASVPCDVEFDLCDELFEQQRYLSQSNDIFRMNRFGTIKERLTNNEFFEGELAVSPDFRQVVFASNRDGDYDLYLADLDDMGNTRRITNTLGYEGGAQFAPDGRTIVFRAWRPKEPIVQKFYRALLSYDLTTYERMNVYALDLTNGEETKITAFEQLWDTPELNNTWATPYFSYAPNGQLYIRQRKHFFCWNASTEELIEVRDLFACPNLPLVNGANR